MRQNHRMESNDAPKPAETMLQQDNQRRLPAITIWNENLKAWGISSGTFLQGIGTVILAIAAIVASSKANDVLKEVLLIQQQAGDIKSQNSAIQKQTEEIGKQSADIKESLRLLTEQLKNLEASKAVINADDLKGRPVVSKEKIEEALKSVSNPTSAVGVYLPPGKRDQVIDGWMKTIDPQKRKQILMDQLEVNH